MQDNQDLIDFLAQTIFDKKGFNILVLDVSGVSTLADTFIIAEGNVGRHVVALSKAIQEALWEQGLSPIATEGEDLGEWVVLDYGSVMIHLFQPYFRERYALEELWRDGQVVDARIQIESSQRAMGER